MSRAPEERNGPDAARTLSPRMRRLAIALAVGVVVASLGAGEWSGGRRDIPLEGDGSTWLVRATLNGHVKGLFLLDTGSTLCVLSRDIAKRLALPPADNTVTVQTANGKVRSPVFRLTDVDVGGTRAGGVDAVVHEDLPDGIDGMLGLSFLNRFSYSVDPRRRTLRLQ